MNKETQHNIVWKILVPLLIAIVGGLIVIGVEYDWLRIRNKNAENENVKYNSIEVIEDSQLSNKSTVDVKFVPPLKELEGDFLKDVRIDEGAFGKEAALGKVNHETDKTRIAFIGVEGNNGIQFDISNANDNAMAFNSLFLEVVDWKECTNLNDCQTHGKGGEMRFVFYETAISKEIGYYEAFIHGTLEDKTPIYENLSGNSTERFMLNFKTNDPGVYTVRIVADYNINGSRYLNKSDTIDFAAVSYQDFENRISW